MKKYQHQDVATAPSGWKVRTVASGSHKIRVAFPPGRRQKGSGKLVSILHPRGENPLCGAMRNPAELVLMGANPHKNEWWNKFNEREKRFLKKIGIKAAEVNSESQYLGAKEALQKIDTIREREGIGRMFNATGDKRPKPKPGESPESYAKRLIDWQNERMPKPIRDVLNNRQRLNPMFNANFTEDEKMALGRLGIKWSAIQSKADVRRARKALKTMDKARQQFGNPLPMSEQRERAAEIYSGFHAAPPENKIVLDEPHIPAGAYPELGLLISVGFKPTPNAKQPYEQNFVTEKENVHVIGNLDRDQIYFAGGDQKMSEKDLRFFGWQGEKEFHLGTAVRIVYLARKYHEAVPPSGRGELVEWVHDLGEETGEKPMLWYDAQQQRIFFKHGAYEIRDEGIVN